MKKSTKSPATFLVAYTQVLSVRRWMSLLKNPIVLSCLSLFLMASNCDDDPEVTPKKNSTEQSGFGENPEVNTNNSDGTSIYYKAIEPNEVRSSSAILRGESNTDSPNQVFFRLGETDESKIATAEISLNKEEISQDGKVFSLKAEGLKPKQTYIYMFVIDDIEKNIIFTTKEANVLTIDLSEPSITNKAVKLAAKAASSKNSDFIEYSFTYQKEGGETVTINQDSVKGNATEGYGTTVKGLAVGKYTVKAFAKTADQTEESESKSFAIEAIAPTVITNAPTVSENDVTLSGDVSDNGREAPTAHTFVYTDAAGKETTVAQDDITSTAADGFTATVEDLPMGTYAVVATATNSAGTSEGESQSFTIEVGAPTVETTKATLKEGEFLVDLAGKVTNTNGGEITNYQFKITTPDGTTRTIVKSRISGVPTDEFTFEADSLYDPGTYKIQAVATNQYGTTEGNALEYVVEGPPSFTIHTPDNPYTAKTEGETITLTFSTESDWEVGDITELLTFSKSSGSAGDNQSIIVTIPANEFDTEQIYFVDFFVSGGDGETLGSLEITQAGVE